MAVEVEYGEEFVDEKMGRHVLLEQTVESVKVNFAICDVMFFFLFYDLSLVLVLET